MQQQSYHTLGGYGTICMRCPPCAQVPQAKRPRSPTDGQTVKFVQRELQVRSSYIQIRRLAVAAAVWGSRNGLCCRQLWVAADHAVHDVSTSQHSRLVVKITLPSSGSTIRQKDRAQMSTCAANSSGLCSAAATGGETQGVQLLCYCCCCAQAVLLTEDVDIIAQHLTGVLQTLSKQQASRPPRAIASTSLSSPTYGDKTVRPAVA